MDNKYNLFLILKGKNEKCRIPIMTFIARNYDLAKTYFIGHISENKHPEEFALYKIGEIQKDYTLKPTKIFICGGFEEIKGRQMKFSIADLQANIKKKETKEILKKLFEGEEINELAQ